MLRVLARDRDGHERSASYSPDAPICARGASGAIFRDESPSGRVLKIYHGVVDPLTLEPASPLLDQARRRDLERKAMAMLAAAPEPLSDAQGRGRAAIAWPVECVYAPDGRFVGVSMDEVANALGLEEVLTEKLRAQHGLAPTYDHCMHIAENLAAAVARLHQKGHAIVDLTPKCVRVYRDDAQVALVGADKYRVNAGHTVYPARSLTASIAAPELQKSAGARPDLAGEHQDRFALAFLIFQLLNDGRAPFDGVGAGGFDPPADMSRRILDRLYPFGLAAHPQTAPAPDSLHEYWPRNLREMFDAAFAAPESNASSRPAPAQWADALRALREGAKPCAVKPRVHGKARLAGADVRCALCLREQKLSGAAPSQAAAESVAAPHVVRAPPAPPAPPKASERPVKDAGLALVARLVNLRRSHLRVFAAAGALAFVAAFLIVRPNQRSDAASADNALVIVSKDAQPVAPPPLEATAPMAEPTEIEDDASSEPATARADSATIYNAAPTSIGEPALTGYMRFAPRAASYMLAFTVDANGRARDIAIERGGPRGYGFEAEARRLVADARFDTPQGATAPYRARLQLNFPHNSSPANAFAARRAGGASAPAVSRDMARVGGSALVRVGFILGTDGRARDVAVTGHDANAQANPALFEAEARDFIQASSFETPPDMPREGLRSSYMVEFTPTAASAAAAPQAAGRRAWRWARRPTGEDLNKEFPERASAARRSGEVTLACLVQNEGELSCAVVSETPNGYRFGAAALRVMRNARVATTLSNGDSSVGAQITVPIHFEYQGNDAD